MYVVYTMNVSDQHRDGQLHDGPQKDGPPLLEDLLWIDGQLEGYTYFFCMVL